MTVAFRPMQAEDAPAIAALHRRAILATGTGIYTEAQLLSWAAGINPERYLRAQAEGETFEIATVDGVVAGFCSHVGNGVIGLYVDPAWQGHGLGGHLLDHAEAAIAARGFAVVVIKGAATARSFYEARHYRVAAETDHHSHGGEILRVALFEKNLPQGRGTSCP